MEQDKYKKLLEDMTTELKKLNGTLPLAISEINHLKEAIEAAEKSIKLDSKEQIEKRG